MNSHKSSLLAFFILIAIGFMSAQAANDETSKIEKSSELESTNVAEANQEAGSETQSTFQVQATSSMTDAPSVVGACGSEVGLDSAKFIVSHAGALSYDYPIELPSGTNGLTPSLSLAYSSSRGNGMLGMGFTLEGLPMIERDSSFPVRFNSGDHYIYNGQKLIPGSDGWFYTEREGYEKIGAFANAAATLPTSDPNTTSSYWVVSRKDGTKLFFGSTDDSRIDAVGKGGLPRLWALNTTTKTPQVATIIQQGSPIPWGMGCRASIPLR
jgi:hypothetical protein